MQIDFLEARMPLTKKYTPSTKTPYPNAYEFSSHTEKVNTLEQLAAAIKAHALKGHCLLKGNLDRPLEWESRAGHTDPHAPTSWLCLDLDGLKAVSSVDDALHKMGLGAVSYIVQWSASYGMYGDFSLRCHVFVLLIAPVSPATIKIWTKGINLAHFTDDISLTRSDVALRWPLDITTGQNDKLLFIAPPECDPATLCPFTGERIMLVKKTTEKLDFHSLIVSSAEDVRQKEIDMINVLRKNKGLSEKKNTQYKLKEYKGEMYMPNPGQATVSGQKTERGFVYFNINGGDSWGYFHPEDNPMFIFNFKGEPTYKTSELLPDYWDSLQKAKKQAVRTANKSKIFLAFRDFRSAEYFNGWYDTAADEITLFQAKNEKQLADFLISYGQPVPDAVPLWEITHDPNLPAFEPTKNRVNLFKFSDYMKKTKTLKSSKPAPRSFPTIEYLINHVVGPSLSEHFINWLAFCYQFKTAPRTAIVLHGTQGTGKGLLINEIVVPLFGSWNVSQRRMEELEDRFNAHLESALIVYVDEAQISDSARSKMIMANIKNQITEPTITIRKMRQTSYEVPNRVGWIFGSNMPDPVTVEIADRRFNVGDFQPKRLSITDSDLTQIKKELTAFALYLEQYAVDPHKVRTPLHTKARDQMMQLSLSSADIVAKALIDGDLAILWEALPTVDQSKIPASVAIKLSTYKALLHEIVRTKKTKISRDELLTIFEYNVGNVPSSAWKFTSYLRHHGLDMKYIRVNDKVVKGTTVEWINDDDWFNERLSEIGSNVTKLKQVS